MSKIVKLMDTWLRMKYGEAVNHPNEGPTMEEQQSLSGPSEMHTQTVHLNSHYKQLLLEKERKRTEESLNVFEPVKIDWKYARSHSHLISNYICL